LKLDVATKYSFQKNCDRLLLNESNLIFCCRTLWFLSHPSKMLHACVEETQGCRNWGCRTGS